MINMCLNLKCKFVVHQVATGHLLQTEKRSNETQRVCLKLKRLSFLRYFICVTSEFCHRGGTGIFPCEQTSSLLTRLPDWWTTQVPFSASPRSAAQLQTHNDAVWLPAAPWRNKKARSALTPANSLTRQKQHFVQG